MSDQQARVTSVDAIESFRANLILFLSKARPTLEEVTAEVTRTRQWLQNDQRTYWEKQSKLRGRELERAQSELFSARLSKIQQASAAQQMAVHRAQRAIREAEDKMRILKKWSRDLENRTEPMVKQIDQLHGYLMTDMARAVAHLGEIIKTLEAYAEVASARPPSPVPTSEPLPEPQPPSVLPKDPGQQ